MKNERTGALRRGCAFLVLGIVGCAGSEVDQGAFDFAGDEPLSSRLQTIDRDIAPGAVGNDVRAVHQYLHEFGYFPNDALQRDFPAWRPLAAELPADPNVFDARSQSAIQQFQLQMGLPQTGIVDSATRDVLKQPRCGVPDGMARPDGTEKFALLGSSWPRGATLKWELKNSLGGGGISQPNLPQIKAAISSAFSRWSAQTSLSFVEQSPGDITIEWAALGAGTLGVTQSPANGGDVKLTNSVTWSVQTPNPANTYDLETVLFHELGHSLGITHSSVIPNAGVMGAAMYGAYQGQHRVPEVDDVVAISSLYDTWTPLPGGGCVKDIATNWLDGGIWGTACGSGDTTIWKFNGSGWDLDAAQGRAIRIAVGRDGRPWVVTQSGSIWHRSSSDVATGFWENVPGCAKDIGVDTTVWTIGCTAASGGFRVERLVGSTFVPEPLGGAGLRIAVDDISHPWITNSSNQIFRMGDFLDVWNRLPGAASDIAISGHNGRGYHNYAWVIGTNSQPGGNFSIHVLDEQGASSVGTPPAPARQQWVQVPGGAVAATVGNNGKPLVVSADGTIWVNPK